MRLAPLSGLAFLPLLAACSTKDTGQDTALPPPGDLVAGYAEARIPCPVGIGTAGFGPFGAPDSDSPFADLFPATTRIHGHPSIRVAVLSRGPGYELVFVRVDTVGVFQQLREKLVQDLEVRLGRNLDDALIFGATHTHSGPGRVVDGDGLLGLIADSFSPEFYSNLMDALADTVEAAWADARPARLAHGVATCPDAHDDRRCEDGLDYENPALPYLAIERDGVLDGFVGAYAVHGTILGIEELTLGRDSMGGVEHAVEGVFDHPVHVMMFNSWGADMSPGSPDVPSRTGAPQPDGFDRMEQVGLAAGQAVAATVTDLAFDAEPEIRARTYRTPIDRDVLGYGTGEFDYEYGAVYCEGESDCDPATTVDGLDGACLPFSEEWPAPTQTLFTVARAGDLHLVTFTGEPGTLLAEKVMAGFQAHDDVTDVMFLGYTQDYLGYSILEDDWWQGGYEASGGLWGPLQGEYLSNEAIRGIDDFTGGAAFGEEPSPTPPFDDPTFTPYAACPALGAGSVVTQVLPSYGPTDVVVFAVNGQDPWLGAPRAVLLDEAGAVVPRTNGKDFDSDGYGFWVDLAVEPPWDTDATERTFTWQVSMPVQHTYDLAWPVLTGTRRIRLTLPDGAGGTVDVDSDPFTVSG